MNKNKQLKFKPMSDTDIHQTLPNQKIVEYNEFSKLNDITDLLSENVDSVIILYQREPREGHWCSLVRIDDNIYYFDPYGYAIDTPLNWVSHKVDESLGQGSKWLSKLLDKSNLNSFYNTFDYQGHKDIFNKEDNKRYSIATCGRHSCSFVKYMMKYKTNLRKYKQYMEGLKRKTGLNFDDIVSQLIPL